MMEEMYLKSRAFLSAMMVRATPYARRVLRFIAFPHWYFNTVNWNECTSSRIQVVKDFLYIFFKLKYYPDNYTDSRLWEVDREKWRFYYGSNYEPYQRYRLQREVQRKEYEILFDDKYVCYQLCKAGGLPLPYQYGCLYPDMDYRSSIASALSERPDRKLIIKPVRGRGGRGTVLAFGREGGEIAVRDLQREMPLDKYAMQSPSVMQEYVAQHETLARVAPSTNTIRIVTLLTKGGDVLIIGAIIRFGVGNTFVDNATLGGLGVGVNLESGTLMRIAYDNLGRKYLHHPNAGIAFEGFQLPYWEEVKGLARRSQQVFHYYRLLGFDVLITPEGPIVVEINRAHDNNFLEQACGPILADPRVREEFDRYDLLVTRFCMQ